jgi:3-hydroxyacyl-CoA dehydrogenase
VPAGGGCKETLYRWIEKLGCADDIAKASWKAFMNIGYGKTASSPLLARDLAMLRDNDRFLMNRDRLFDTAVEAIGNPSGQQRFVRPALAMPGRPLFEEMCQWLRDAQQKGLIYPHDVVVGSEIARIISGGDIEPGTVWSEQELYDAERRSFLTLASSEATRARIDSMLDNGVAIRN